MSQINNANIWEICTLNNDYEINTEYPYPIRKRSNQRVIREYDNGNGYIRCEMSGRQYYKHVIVATQFIPNPDNLPEIDHINHDRSDYHILNLRWVSRSINHLNRRSTKGIEHEWIDDEDLPDDLIEVTDYNHHEFEEYYFSPSLDRFMFWNGIRTRLLRISYKPNGSAFVNMMNNNNINVQVHYSKFKRLYDIPM